MTAPITPKPKKPGYVARENDAAQVMSDWHNNKITMNQGISREQAFERQHRVANDEPAVEGSDRPSEIRKRALRTFAERVKSNASS